VSKVLPKRIKILSNQKIYTVENEKNIIIIYARLVDPPK
jgi:hypothetical protein